MKEFSAIIVLDEVIELLDKLDDEKQIDENKYYHLRDEVQDIKWSLERVLWHIKGLTEEVEK